MLSKYTIVGMAVGIVISGIGISALVDSLMNPVRIIEFDENLEAGDNQTYSFNARSNSEQKIAVTGDSAHIGLTKPGEPENGYDFKKNGDLQKQRYKLTVPSGQHRLFMKLFSPLLMIKKKKQEGRFDDLAEIDKRFFPDKYYKDYPNQKPDGSKR